MDTATAPTYVSEPEWERPPHRNAYQDYSDVAVDSGDRVYLLSREPRVLVYDRAGELLGDWGHDLLSKTPHGITVGPDDHVYVVDEGDCTVKRFTRDGTLVQTIGTPGRLSDSGCDWSLTDFQQRLASITRGAPPFNHPTAVAVTAAGDLFVSDGYGNARVHHFSASGDLIRSWGRPGNGPGEFHVPHAIVIDSRGRLLVADRENDRVQVFTQAGEHVETWNEMRRPQKLVVDDQGLVYVAEGRWRPGELNWGRNAVEQEEGQCYVGVFDANGHRLARLGGGEDKFRPGSFAIPHGLAIDSRGTLYVAELTRMGHRRIGAGTVPEYAQGLQKLVRA